MIFHNENKCVVLLGKYMLQKGIWFMLLLLKAHLTIHTRMLGTLDTFQRKYTIFRIKHSIEIDLEIKVFVTYDN